MKRIIAITFTIVGMIFLCGNVQADLSSGLVAYYPFDGNANDGVVNGATLTTDRFGSTDSAYSFDGINDYISLPQNLMSTPSEITMSVWVKFNSSATSMAISIEGWYVFYLNKFGAGTFTPLFDGSSSNGDAGWGSNLNDDQWHHLLATNSGSTLKVYIDGNYEGSVGESIGDVDSIDVESTIGGDYRRDNPYSFSGIIDDVRIYSVAMSEAEIQELYSEGDALSVSPTSVLTSIEDIKSLHVQGGSAPYTVNLYDDSIIEINESVLEGWFYITGKATGSTTITIIDSEGDSLEVAVTVTTYDESTTSTYDPTTGECDIDIAVVEPGVEDSDLDHYSVSGNVATVSDFLQRILDIQSSNPGLTADQLAEEMDGLAVILLTDIILQTPLMPL